MQGLHATHDLADGFRVIGRVDNDELQLLIVETGRKRRAIGNPFAVRRLSRITQDTVDQLNIVLIPAQDGNRYTLSVIHVFILNRPCLVRHAIPKCGASVAPGWAN